MSLLRAALGLGLLLLGLQAQKLESHRKHHKHRKVLLSHGRSKYELVETSAVVNGKSPEDYWNQMQAKAKQKEQQQQRIDSGPSAAKELDSAEKDIKKVQTEQQPAEKQAEDQIPVDAGAQQAQDRTPVDAVMEHWKQGVIAQDDAKAASVHTELAAANPAKDFNHIRQELRFSKKRKHEIQVLKQSLAVEQKLLDESSSLQLASKDDDESETMVQSQIQQLDDMKIKLRALVESKTTEATKASHQAEEEAKAMREAATVAEQKAEQELKQSKEIKARAEKLEKIAEKQLGKLEKPAKPANH